MKLIVNDDFCLRQSLDDLESYSLIRVWDEGRKITIHRLVQYVIRDDLESNAHNVLIAQIIQMACSAFPYTVKGINRGICRRYQSQVMAILANIDNRTDIFGWHVLAEQLAFYFGEDGYYSSSLELYSDCINIKVRLLGSEHPKTLRSMSNLAVPSS